MVCTQLDTFPQTSRARQVRLTDASQGNVPDIVSKLDTKAAVQLSVAVAIPVTEGRVSVAQVTVVLGGQTMVGSILSLTVITCKQLEVLPQASRAVQVRLIRPLQGSNMPKGWSENVKVDVAPQLSVAVAVPAKLGVATFEQETVVLGGQVIVGGTLSRMNMVWTHVAVLPQPSVAVHVRKTVPSQGIKPDTTSVFRSVTRPQLSDAVGVPVTEGRVSDMQLTVVLAGQVMTGAVLSTTVTG